MKVWQKAATVWRNGLIKPFLRPSLIGKNYEKLEKLRWGTRSLGWEFARSIFWSLLFRSLRSLKKSNREWSDLAALKEWLGVNFSCRSLQKNNLEWIALDIFKKERRKRLAHDLSELFSKKSDSLETKYFSFVFVLFTPKELIAPVALCLVALF